MKKQRLFSLLAAVVLITAGSLSAQTNGSEERCLMGAAAFGGWIHRRA
jgi:hypothetical protein